MLETAFLLALAIFWVLTPLFFHEMGHWVVLRRYGVPVKEHWLGLGPAVAQVGAWRIGMLPVGAALVPEPEAYAALPPLARVQVALAGPAASLLYGVVSLVVYLLNTDMPGAKALYLLSGLNFLLGLLNLVPVPPLDGFQAYKAWREHRNQPLNPRALEVANRAGSGLVYGVGFFVLGLFFFVW